MRHPGLPVLVPPPPRCVALGKWFNLSEPRFMADNMEVRVVPTFQRWSSYNHPDPQLPVCKMGGRRGCPLEVVQEQGGEHIWKELNTLLARSGSHAALSWLGGGRPAQHWGGKPVSMAGFYFRVTRGDILTMPERDRPGEATLSSRDARSDGQGSWVPDPARSERGFG